MLREHKKEVFERAKRQAGTRRVVAKGRVLKAGEAAEQIRTRRKEEVELAEHTAKLRGKREERRKAFTR
jgi:hypothetical protein